VWSALGTGTRYYNKSKLNNFVNINIYIKNIIRANNDKLYIIRLNILHTIKVNNYLANFPS